MAVGQDECGTAIQWKPTIGQWVAGDGAAKVAGQAHFAVEERKIDSVGFAFLDGDGFGNRLQSLESRGEGISAGREADEQEFIGEGLPLFADGGGDGCAGWIAGQGDKS